MDLGILPLQPMLMLLFQHSPSNRSHLQMDVFAIIFELGWSLSLGEQVSHILLTRDILQGDNLMGDLVAGIMVLDINMFSTLVLGVLLGHGQAGGVILVDQSGSTTRVSKSKGHLS